MTTVFVGGSRHASRLSAPVRLRIDKIIDKGFPILIGDANGADKAVQQYLRTRHYTNVEVFCSAGICRNNVGEWRIRSIPADARSRTAQFYSAKDRAMAEEATVGLMIWDGESVGTLLNVLRLLSLEKKAVIYLAKERRFLELRNRTEWDQFIQSRDAHLRQKVVERARAEPATARPVQASLLG